MEYRLSATTLVEQDDNVMCKQEFNYIQYKRAECSNICTRLFIWISIASSTVHIIILDLNQKEIKNKIKV